MRHMKRFIYSLGLVILSVSCGDDKNEIPQPEIDPDLIYDMYFMGYHVEDTTGFDKETLQFYTSNDTAWIYAIKDQAVWFGMFNDNTKEQIAEWQGASSEKSGYDNAFPVNPHKVGDKYVCFMDLPEEEDLSYRYRPFLLSEGKAYPLHDIEVGFGNEDYITVKGAGENILVVLPSNRGGSVYSPTGEEIVSSVATKEILESDMGKEYFSGFKDGKTWLGVCENGEMIAEYTSRDTYDRNITIDMGYGEYREHYVEVLSFGYSNSGLLETEWGYVFYPLFKNEESDYDGGDLYDAFLCKDGVMQPVFVGEYDYRFMSNWYDESILIGRGVFSQEGERIVEFEDEYYDLGEDPMLLTFLKEPCSYTHMIRVAHARAWADYTVVSIERYDLINEETIWSVNVDALGTSAEDSKYAATIVEKDDNSWTLEVSVTSYEGDRKTALFRLNTNTGDITYL